MITIYCRNCGTEISEKAAKCPSCFTVRGEGVDYCHNCGHVTYERQEHCRNCGAKLNTIVPKKVLQDRKNNLLKDANRTKKIFNIIKVINIISLVSMIVLILILVLRPSPDNIPEPFSVMYTDGVLFGDSGVYTPSDYYSYADSNVQKYWSQGRALIGYIVFAFVVFIGSIINRILWKKKYKRIVKAYKEVKDVL